MKQNYKKDSKTKNSSNIKKQIISNNSSKKITKNIESNNNIGFISIYGNQETNTNPKLYKSQGIEKNSNTPSYIVNNYYYNNFFFEKTKSLSKPISPIGKSKTYLSDSKDKKYNNNYFVDIKMIIPTPKALFRNTEIINKDYKINNFYLSNKIDLVYDKKNKNNNNNNLKKNIKNNSTNNCKKYIKKISNNNKKCSINTDNINNLKKNNIHKEYFNNTAPNNNNTNSTNNNNFIYFNSDNNKNNYTTTIYKDFIDNSTNFNTIEYINNNNTIYNSINSNSKDYNIMKKKMKSNLENYTNTVKSLDLYQNLNDNNDSNSKSLNKSLYKIKNRSQTNIKRNNKSENKTQLNKKSDKHNIKEYEFRYHPKFPKNSSNTKIQKINNSATFNYNSEKYLEKNNNLCIIKIYSEKNIDKKNIKSQKSTPKPTQKTIQKQSNYTKKEQKNNTNNKYNEKNVNKIPRNIKKVTWSTDYRIKNNSQDFLSKNSIKNKSNQYLSSFMKEENKNIINNKYNNIVSKSCINKRELRRIHVKSNNPSISNLKKINKLIPNFAKPKLISSLNDSKNKKDNKKDSNNNIKIINNRMKNRIKINIMVNRRPKIYSRINRRKTFDLNLLAKMIKKECEICHRLIDSHLFKIHYNSHPSKIFNWLYLGSFSNACDVNELKFNGISNILNCAIECHNTKLPDNIKEMHLKIKDNEKFSIIGFLEQGTEYINKCKLGGCKLLVHCKFGISRSASFIIAYMIKYNNFTVDDALTFVKQKRNQVKPNKGFMNQLYEYEKKIENEK